MPGARGAYDHDGAPALGPELASSAVPSPDSGPSRPDAAPDGADDAPNADGSADVELLRSLIGPRPLGDDRFTIDISAHVEGHLFGGLVAAQALHAAYATVDGARHVQSAHAYFLRRGRPELPIEFQVHRDTDGRSFSARHVAAAQEGSPIFRMICSFHVPEPTAEVLQPMPAVVPPPTSMVVETVNSLGDCFEVRRAVVAGTEPLERRSTGRLWARAAGPLPDDPILHDCLLFYVSDLGSPWNMEAPAHLKVLTSLDHAVWLHHRTRMDEWHYIDLEPGSLADARALYAGRVWRHDGTHVASIAQENLVRPSAE
jgi:acyl-CoA thioesterase-2